MTYNDQYNKFQETSITKYKINRTDNNPSRNCCKSLFSSDSLYSFSLANYKKSYSHIIYFLIFLSSADIFTSEAKIIKGNIINMNTIKHKKDDPMYFN